MNLFLCAACSNPRDRTGSAYRLVVDPRYPSAPGRRDLVCFGCWNEIDRRKSKAKHRLVGADGKLRKQPQGKQREFTVATPTITPNKCKGYAGYDVRVQCDPKKKVRGEFSKIGIGRYIA